jgi:hypothetical protein
MFKFSEDFLAAVSAAQAQPAVPVPPPAEETPAPEAEEPEAVPAPEAAKPAEPVREHMDFSGVSLRDKAVTVRLRRSQFNPYAFDQNATDRAEEGTGATRAGRFNKRLLRRSPEFKAVQVAFRKVHDYFIDNTLPWLDGGQRILPSAEIIEFTQGLSALRDECNKRVQALMDKWDDAVVEDRKALGSLWNPNDYPTKDQLPSLFGVQVIMAPVPDSADFRVEVGEEVKQQLGEAVEEAQANASTYLLKEMLKPLEAAAEKLAVPIGEEGSVFRDTLVRNLTDAAHRAEKLNISGDKRVQKAAEDILKIVGSATPNELRTNKNIREAVRSDISDAAERLSQWF